MKKLLSIIVLGSLLGGNAYAEKLTWNCTGWKNIKWIDWQLDLKTNELSSQWQTRDGKNNDQIARVISSGDNYVIVQDYIKSQMESADNDFINELLYDHYNNEVKNMNDQEFKDHLKNIGMESEK